MESKPGALIAVEVLQWASAGLSALGCFGAIASGHAGVAGWDALVAAVYAFVAYSLRRGSEGARSLLLFTSYASLVFAAFLLVFALLVFASFGGGVLAAVILIVAVGWIVAQAGFTLYTLRRADVQEWMFKRAVGEI